MLRWHGESLIGQKYKRVALNDHRLVVTNLHSSRLRMSTTLKMFYLALRITTVEEDQPDSQKAWRKVWHWKSYHRRMM